MSHDSYDAVIDGSVAKSPNRRRKAALGKAGQANGCSSGEDGLTPGAQDEDSEPWHRPGEEAWLSTPFLYVAVDSAYCKIGVSGNPLRRDRELRYWNEIHQEYRKLSIRHIWYAPGVSIELETAIKRELRALTGVGPGNYETFRVSQKVMLDTVRRCIAWRPVRVKNVSFGIIR